jgi:hypothetical protein
MDANTGVRGDQAFSFVGKDEFTFKVGQIRYEKKFDTWIYLNTDADGAAEAVIRLKGSIDLKKEWFVL